MEKEIIREMVKKTMSSSSKFYTNCVANNMMCKLVVELIDKTTEGKLKWEYDSNEKGFKVNVGDTVILISYDDCCYKLSYTNKSDLKSCMIEGYCNSFDKIDTSELYKEDITYLLETLYMYVFELVNSNFEDIQVCKDISKILKELNTNT